MVFNVRATYRVTKQYSPILRECNHVPLCGCFWMWSKQDVRSFIYKECFTCWHSTFVADGDVGIHQNPFGRCIHGVWLNWVCAHISRYCLHTSLYEQI